MYVVPKKKKKEKNDHSPRLFPYLFAMGAGYDAYGLIPSLHDGQLHQL